MLVRLQKYMADCGVASRRKCEEIIKSGAVSVDGHIVTEMGIKIDTEKSVVMYNSGVVNRDAAAVYIALNKPRGYITSSRDQFGRPTVLDLLTSVNVRVFPVGRLDYDSSGLIFLTNDGDFAYKMTHPRHNIYKKYLLTVKGFLADGAISALTSGVPIENAVTAPAIVSEVNYINSETTELCVSIREGKNRQVRKMMDAVGHPVITLHRTAIGNVEIGGLKSGCYRFLNIDEIRCLL